MSAALDLHVRRTLILKDVEELGRQIAEFESEIRVAQARAATLRAYLGAAQRKLAALGDDDD